MKLLVAYLMLFGPMLCHSASVSQLEKQLDDIRQKHDVPAVGLVIVSPRDTVISRVWGVADVAQEKAATEETMFRIGSVTKAFTSLTFLALHEKELLPIDLVLDSSLGLLPFQNKWEKTNPITIDMLLEHTAGFSDMSKPEWDYSDQKPLKLEDAFLIDPNSRTTKWAPGIHSSYTNSGAGIAAWAAERKLKQPFEELMQAHVFTPLGMHSATLFKTQDVENHLATGYQADGRTIIGYWNMIYRPFGAMNVRLADMQPFLQLLLNRGRHGDKRLLSEAAIKRMETPHTTAAAKSGLEFGYGLGNYQWYRDGYLFHGHGGDGDGYLAHYGYSTELGLGYFVVINAFNHRPLREMRRTIEDFILDGRKKRHRPEVYSLSQEQINGVLGTYHQATQRFGAGKAKTLRVLENKNRLYTQRDGGRRLPLIPVAPGQFRRPHEPGATIAIVTLGDIVVLQGDLGNFERKIN